MAVQATLLCTLEPSRNSSLSHLRSLPKKSPSVPFSPSSKRLLSPSLNKIFPPPQVSALKVVVSSGEKFLRAGPSASERQGTRGWVRYPPIPRMPPRNFRGQNSPSYPARPRPKRVRPRPRLAGRHAASTPGLGEAEPSQSPPPPRSTLLA